jgi:hypothetical protein
VNDHVAAELARPSSPLARRLVPFLEPELRHEGPRAIARIGLRLLDRRAPAEVATWDRASDDALFTDGPAALAAVIAAAAERNTVAGQGCAFVLELATSAGSVVTMRFRYESDEPAGIETATASGLVEQAQRMAEVCLAALLRTSSGAAQQLSEMNSALLERNLQLGVCSA